jgi:CheY-like chemotaxis protein
MGKKSQTFAISYVTSDDNYYSKLLTSFKKLTFSYSFTRLGDGNELIELLTKAKISKKNITPSLVIIDLKLPNMDGNDILDLIQSKRLGTTVPFVILTSPINDQSTQTFDYGLSSSEKPDWYKHMVDLLHLLNKEWFTMVVLPEE